MRWLEERYAENRDEVLGLLAYQGSPGTRRTRRSST